VKDMRKKFEPYILWLIIGLAVIFPACYFVSHLTDPVFLDNSMGNVFATMFGAIIGILIALEINRFQQAILEARQRENQERNRLEHKVKILELIRAELEFNRAALSARQPIAVGEVQRRFQTNRLKDELWNALSSGGELQWISDVQLLDVIAAAYHYVRLTIFLEEKYFDLLHYPGAQFQAKKYPKDYVLEYLTVTDPQVLSFIESAVRNINANLPTGKVAKQEEHQ
jgi:hypothetical protein